MAKALEMLGSNFRNERQTERRNEQLCHSQEEVEYEENPRSCLESGRLGSREILERLGRRITIDDLDYGHEKECQSGQTHTDSDLARCGNRFSTACKSGKYPHHNRSEDDDIERVESLPYFRLYGVGLYEIAGKERE